MEKKEIKNLVVIFVFLLLVGVGIDISKNVTCQEEIIYRQEIGESSTEEALEVTIEGIDGKFDYSVEVEAMRPTSQQAEEYFEIAMEEIDEEFGALDLWQAEKKLPMEKEYVEGIVSAEWTIDPWEVVKTDGTIVYEEILEEGYLINLSVTLTCGEYERIYQFPLEIPYLEKSQEEQFFEALDNWIQSEMKKEGESALVLPQELLGRRIHWSKEKSTLSFSILALECVAMVVIILATKQKKKEEEQKRTIKLELDYPEVVSQLTLLLGAGMNIRQAWNTIATRYLDNRQKRIIAEKIAYEGIVKMNRRIQEGENEKKAYQQFANEMQNTSFHRLIRHLIGNLEKGAKGVCAVLEQETKQAYEQRILQAKKAGEEASTRMLVPLMLMMMVVMAIVMAPAIIDFVG